MPTPGDHFLLPRLSTASNRISYLLFLFFLLPLLSIVYISTSWLSSSFLLSDFIYFKGISDSELEGNNGESLTPDQVLELFMTLFGPQGQTTLPMVIRGNQSSSSSNNMRNHHMTSKDSTDSGTVISDRVELASNPSSPTPANLDSNEERESQTIVMSSLEFAVQDSQSKSEKVGEKMEVSSPIGSNQRQSSLNRPAAIDLSPRDTWTSISNTPAAPEILSPTDGHVRPPRHSIPNSTGQTQSHQEDQSQNENQGMRSNKDQSQRHVTGQSNVPEVVECSTLARSPHNGGPGGNGTAASKLSEALTKLRQVTHLMNITMINISVGGASISETIHTTRVTPSTI